MSKFIDETIQHIEDVRKLVHSSADFLFSRSAGHDADKLAFNGDLSAWLDYFKKGEHFKGNNGNTHHHKEDVQDLFGMIEMLCDWCCASYRRNGAVLDETNTRLPQYGVADIERILRNTLTIIASLARDLFSGVEKESYEDDCGNVLHL